MPLRLPRPTPGKLMLPMITFPTRPGDPGRPVRRGKPTHARACRCENAWLDDGGCVKCGHLMAWTIAEAWAEQARRLRGGHWAGTTPRVSARRLELVG